MMSNLANRSASSAVVALTSFCFGTVPPNATAEYKNPGLVTKLEDGQRVGPFCPPDKVLDLRVPLIYLINGFDTSPSNAALMAQKTAEKLKVPVTLIYNDLYVRDPDWFVEATTWVEKAGATAIEKLGGASFSVNEATATTREILEESIASNQPIYFIVHSAGALSLQNALNDYADENENTAGLSNVHLITVGSACFEADHALSDGWPKAVGSIYHVYDRADPVAQVAGPGSWGDSDLKTHSFLDHYLTWLDLELFSLSGECELEK